MEKKDSKPFVPADDCIDPEFCRRQGRCKTAIIIVNEAETQIERGLSALRTALTYDCSSEDAEAAREYGRKVLGGPEDRPTES